jgi:DNA-binding MarR family transcriptional regulator
MVGKGAEGSSTDELASDTRHLCELLTALLSSTFRQILWKQALELDLTYSQAQVLFHLERHPRALATDLARYFGITLPAVTQVVDRLVGKRLVERAENPKDRRQILLSLTRTGHQLARDLQAARMAGMSEVLQRIPPDERKELVRGIERLVAAARGEAP